MKIGDTIGKKEEAIRRSEIPTDAKAILEFNGHITDKQDRLKDDPKLVNKRIAAFEKWSSYHSIQQISEVNDTLRNTKTCEAEKAPEDGFAPRSEKKTGALGEEMVPSLILLKYFPKNPLGIEGAQQVEDLWQGIVNFVAVLQSAQEQIEANPCTSRLSAEVDKIIELFSFGLEMRMLNINLDKAAKHAAEYNTGTEEVTKALNEIQAHLSDDIIGKINAEIMPKLVEARLGEQVLTFQEDIVRKAGINIKGLKLKGSIDDTEYRAKEQKMAKAFNDMIVKLRGYLDMKSLEEESAHVGHEIRELNEFFKKLNWEWKHKLTPNEFPLFNAVSSPILERVKEAEGHMDALLEELATIKKKSIQTAVNVQITWGLKNKDDATAPSVMAFVKNMKATKEAISKLEQFKDFIDALSEDMVLVWKDLPFVFINDPEFIGDPDKFLAHLEEDVETTKGCDLISKEEYDRKSAALGRIKGRTGALKEFGPEMLAQIHL